MAGAPDESDRHEPRLASLAELESFKVADDDPDPRGWEVVGGDGVPVGRVVDLVVDIESMKVRYLACSTDLIERHGARRQQVLVPLAFARVDPAASRVIVDTLQSGQLVRLPPFGGLPITAQFENEVQRAFVAGLRPPADRPPPGAATDDPAGPERRTNDEPSRHQPGQH
ncbi:MAG TPA: PRC-barrel domain-containing protein [Longimicrobiales bacterium]|nr:PRC-barrel domain-containing protein [Longimicrobiales bacterium]